MPLEKGNVPETDLLLKSCPLNDFPTVNRTVIEGGKNQLMVIGANSTSTGILNLGAVKSETFLIQLKQIQQDSENSMVVRRAQL